MLAFVSVEKQIYMVSIYNLQKYFGVNPGEESSELRSVGQGFVFIGYRSVR